MDDTANETAAMTDVSGRLDALRRLIDSVRDELEDAFDQLADLQKTDAKHTDRLDDLEDRVERLESRTALLRVAEHNAETTAEERTKALLVHLQRKTEQTGGPKRARLDHESATEALSHPDVDRTTIYQDLRRAARWVGDETVCWYEDGRLYCDLTDADATLGVSAA